MPKGQRNFNIFCPSNRPPPILTTFLPLVSVISGLLIVWLFFSELSFYLSTEVNPELFVDTSRGEKLRINMDVTFPNLPCACMNSKQSPSLFIL